MGKVTLFKSISTTNDPHHVSLKKVLDRIKKGNQKDLIKKIRGIKDKAGRNVLKKQLQCALFSGTFKKRSKKGLIDHSGYICLDFDSFKDDSSLKEFKVFARSNLYTHSLFLSPSGNGFKLIVKIPTTDHLGSFLALQDYYTENNWGDFFDKTTKDVSRICYNSYDTDLFYNEDSDTFEEIKEDIILNKPTNTIVKIDNNDEIIVKLIRWWDTSYGFVQGNKNNNLFILASAFNQYGIPEFECSRYFLSNYFQPPCKDANEITNIVQNAYKDIATHNTKSFEDRDAVSEIERLSHKGTTAENISKKTGVSIEAIAEVLDNSEKNVFWSKNSKGIVNTIMLKYKYFLENNGYFKYKSEESDEFVFVRVKNNLIENTTEIDMKNFILNYLEQLEDKSIYEHFAKKSSSHFTESALNVVANVKINLRLDSKNIGYVYYRNCAVKVTPNDLKIVDYIDLDGAVWKSHVIARDFKLSDDYDNDYKTFVRNISKDGREDVLKSAESALGYLMHNFNDRKTQKAIILNDSKQTGSSEEGGIGKGLFVQGVEQIRRTIIEDGKDFDDKGTFKYQRVGLDTQVFSFDDVPKNFRFEKLFSVITDGMTVEKKNKTAVKLKYSDSPKIVITTNYVIKGRGNSHDRRKFEIEFGEFYGAHLNPADHFKQELFNDWDSEHFVRFDNYMISLIQLYMTTGLIASKSDTAKVRKLIAQTDPLFVGWMDAMVDDMDKYVGYLDFHKICMEESGLTKLLFKDFSMWVEDYCISNDYTTDVVRNNKVLQIQIRNNKKDYKSRVKDGAKF